MLEVIIGARPRGSGTLLLIVVGAALAGVRFAAADPAPGCEPIPAYLAGSNGRLLLKLEPADGRITAVSNMGLTGHASGIAGLAYDANNQVFYAYDQVSEHLATLDPVTGNLTVVGYTGISSLTGLALDPASSKLYAVDGATGHLLLIDAATGVSSVVGWIGPYQVSGLAFNPASGVLYSVDLISDVLLVIDPVTAAAVPAPGPIGLVQVVSLAFDPAGGVLYGVDVETSQLLAIDPDNGAGALIGALLNGAIRAIGFDATQGVLHGIEQGTGCMTVLDTSSGSATRVGSPRSFGMVTGLAYDAGANALLAVDEPTGALLTVDMESGLPQFIGLTGFSGVRDMAMEPGTGTLYAVDQLTGELLTIDRSTGTATAAGVSGFGCVSGLEFHPDTAILYGADTCTGSLIRIDLPAGTRTPVGPLGFTNVTALAFDSSAGNMCGLDATLGQLVRVDLTTGAATGVGPLGFTSARSLAIDASGGHAYSVSTTLDALLRVDRATGKATTVRRLGGNTIHALAFDGQSAMLFGMDSNTGRLLEVDARDGDSRPIGLVGTTQIDSLAVHPSTHLLYGFDRAASQLVLLDTATAQATLVGPSGVGALAGLAFDEGGILYGAGQLGLYAVDTATGGAVLVGPFNVEDGSSIRSLTFDTSAQQLLGLSPTRLTVIDRTTGAATSVAGARVDGLSGVEWIPGAILPECRSELTYAMVTRLNPSSSDTGPLPESDDVFFCGQPFYIEFWARDDGLVSSGVTCAYADLLYDHERVQVGAIAHSTLFSEPVFASGVDDGVGRIDELGGCHLPVNPGQAVGIDPAWVCVARVQMNGLPDPCSQCSAHPLPLALAPGTSESSVYGRGNVVVDDIGYGSATPALRCPCLYDLSGDCSVNALDLGIMAASWRKCVGDPAYNPRADFDCSGCFAGGDIGFLATAWLRECSDPGIVLAACQGCGSAPPVVRAQAQVDARETVQFALHLTGRPSDSSVLSGELPESQTVFRAGQQVFAEFWTRDLDGSAGALVAVYADVSFARREFELAGARTAQAFGLLSSGDGEAARVVALGGATVGSGVASLQWVRVGTVELVALQDTEAPRISIRPTPLEPAARYGHGALPSEQIQVLQPVPLTATADFDRDGDVDQTDFGTLQRCLASSVPSEDCSSSDLNGDLRVDGSDLSAFQDCISGPALRADPECGW